MKVLDSLVIVKHRRGCRALASAERGVWDGPWGPPPWSVEDGPLHALADQDRTQVAEASGRSDVDRIHVQRHSMSCAPGRATRCNPPRVREDNTVNIARVQRALLHSQMAVIELSNQVRRLETEAVHWRERAVLLEAKLAEHQQEQEKAA
jgi:hypothetical protein